MHTTTRRCLSLQGPSSTIHFRLGDLAPSNGERVVGVGVGGRRGEDNSNTAVTGHPPMEDTDVEPRGLEQWYGLEAALNAPVIEGREAEEASSYRRTRFAAHADDDDS